MLLVSRQEVPFGGKAGGRGASLGMGMFQV